MRQITLQTLTWGTVTAAVLSALCLAASEPSWPELRKPGANRLDASGEAAAQSSGTRAARDPVVRPVQRGVLSR
jgi:hypothetical protein